MSAKYCLTHRGVGAVMHCVQCHKPICGECITQDKFCTGICAELHRKFTTRYPPWRKPPLIVRLARGLAFLAVGAGALWAALRYLGLSIGPG